LWAWPARSTGSRGSKWHIRIRNNRVRNKLRGGEGIAEGGGSSSVPASSSPTRATRRPVRPGSTGGGGSWEQLLDCRGCPACGRTPPSMGCKRHSGGRRRLPGGRSSGRWPNGGLNWRPAKGRLTTESMRRPLPGATDRERASAEFRPCAVSLCRRRQQAQSGESERQRQPPRLRHRYQAHHGFSQELWAIRLKFSSAECRRSFLFSRPYGCAYQGRGPRGGETPPLQPMDCWGGFPRVGKTHPQN
jgi:hypothetical protein